MELAAQNFSQVPQSSVGIAVCYRCSYQAHAGGSCPECSFPMIVQSGLSSPEIRLGDVLKRESLRIGAPPLPGVDAGPRKAQLLAEARKRIRDRDRNEEASEAESRAETAPVTRRSIWAVLSVCCVAVSVGVVAAAVQSVLL